MAYLHFKNVGITGIAAVVPKKIIKNSEYTHFMSAEEVASIIKMTGIAERRFADDQTCSSDLCLAAAERLLNDNKIDRTEIDILIFVSQTPDYRTPPTSMLLQDKLNLAKSTGAFDINLGCSGYVYGLATAFLMASQPGIRKVLLLNGETKSKAYSTKDKSTSLLFGDAGAATLVEKIDNENPTVISMNSDGSGYEHILMPGGGYRKPSSVETLLERQYEDGSIRTEEHGSMNGPAVFNFTITSVPADIKATLAEASTNWDEIDYFIPHQANKFITDHIAKKFKISPGKVLYSLDKYGNTSSVSIPLTLVSRLGQSIKNKEIKVALSGFGVGLSWGTVITSLSHCSVSALGEL